MYDCIIVGAGAAGLSAGIYMARFMRSTLIVDLDDAKPTYRQVNDNYLGFPDGITTRDLRAHGRKQAERFGAHFKRAEVTSLRKTPEGFILETTAGELEAKTVILCTGVEDVWPAIPGVDQYVGRTLYSSFACDGKRAQGKNLIVFGDDDAAAALAARLRLFTNSITFVHRPGTKVDTAMLEAAEVKVAEGEPASVDGSPAALYGVVLKDGTRVHGEVMFSMYPPKPNNKLAIEVGAKVDDRGHVVVDERGRTSVPNLFCAGDLAHNHAHEMISAAHEGAETAQAANDALYTEFTLAPAASVG